MLKLGSSNSAKAVSTLGVQVIKYPIAILSSILIANKYGADIKGVSTYLIMLKAVFLPVGTFGLRTSLHYFIANATLDKSDLGFSTVAFSTLIGGLIGAAIIFAYHAGVLGEISASIPTSVLYVTCLLIPLEAINYLLISINRGIGDYHSLSSIEIVGSVSYLLVIGICLALGVEPIKAIVAAMISETFMLVGPQVGISIRNGVFKNFTYPTKVAPLFRYGTKSIGGDISSQANDRLDVFLIGSFGSAETLGVYSIAYSVAKLLTIVPTAVAPIFINYMTPLIKKYGAHTAEVRERLGFICRAILLVTLVSAVGLAIISTWLIPILYGDEFRAAVMPCYILIAGLVLFASVRRVIDKYHLSANLPWYPTIVQSSALVVTVVAGLILIPRQQLMGAAWTSALCWTFGAMVSIWQAMRTANIRPRELLIPTRGDLVELEMSAKTTLARVFGNR